MSPPPKFRPRSKPKHLTLKPTVSATALPQDLSTTAQYTALSVLQTVTNASTLTSVTPDTGTSIVGSISNLVSAKILTSSSCHTQRPDKQMATVLGNLHSISVGAHRFWG